MTKVTTKPYLVRAIYEWCIDQGYTPHIAVLVDEHTLIPPGYARDGQIVLNLGPEATHQLVMGNDVISFEARFGGVAHPLAIPVGNVIAVYARENGQGMAFEPNPPSDEEDADEAPETLEANEAPAADPQPSAPAAPPARAPSERGAHLKVVK